MKYSDYLDKVRACWLGKNIGGTLGAPFESFRCAVDIDYYTHDLSVGVLPNDDLDLQLVWLNAAERYGTAVDAEILSTYWVTGITAYWSEYGAGMNNLDNGILPPASGAYRNPFKESCGAFIRSEIWACLAPGYPEIAVKYAYEDACIDHHGEGIWAELFCAALQSAAFVESDPDTLIDTALSYIPDDCAVAKAIAVVRAAYSEGVDWKEARRRVLKTVPGTFGLRYSSQEHGIPEGKLGFDAPSNIGLMILGWLFGGNDFSKSVCIAAGCGEDADCTAGTLAATFGIINGTKSIDKKWTDPIGDEIKTIAINRANPTIQAPVKVSDLTRRVAALMPVFMKEHIRVSEEGQIELLHSADMKKTLWKSGWMEQTDPFWYMNQKDLMAKKSNSLFDVYVMMNDPEIGEQEEKQIRFCFINRTARHLWANIRVELPEDWGEDRKRSHACWLNEWASGSNITDYQISLPATQLKKDKYAVDLFITANGYPTLMHIPLVLVKR